MKITKCLDKYLNDDNYQIIVMKDMVNVINYIEIKDFSNSKIVIKNSLGITNIIGEDLTIVKMLDREILIVGTIKRIDF
mgnify:CR=1 FL=1